jgi:hypothetical protein
MIKLLQFLSCTEKIQSADFFLYPFPKENTYW